MATPGTAAAPYLAITTNLANENLDTWVPPGRTTTNVPAYLANNAVFNVKDFGATGNGSTDDTAAIQTAITAAGPTGGIVFLPVGIYVVSNQLILPTGVSLVGTGMGAASTNVCRLWWTGTTGFCVKAGNTAGTLSSGIRIENLGINITTSTASGIWLYGARDCQFRNVYIEGQPGTTTSIGVQIDGANISAFFNLMENVHCNHVFKGYVHTTTGTTQPTQTTGINCSAICDSTAGSMGLDVQNVGGVGCGDGVLYVGGDWEACAIGVHLNGGGTTLLGCRFENLHTNVDVQFDTLARNNQIIGGSQLYTLLDTAASRTNQVIGVPKDEVGIVSQVNLLDSVEIRGGNLGVGVAPNTSNHILLSGATTTGTTQRGMTVALTSDGTDTTALEGIYVQPVTAAASYTATTVRGAHIGNATVGAGSAITTQVGIEVDSLTSGSTNYAIRTNGGLHLFSGAVTIGSGGAAITGNSTVTGSLAVSTGFGANGATPQTAYASGGAAPAGGTGATAGAYDTSAHRDALITLVNNMRTALVNAGIMS
jgi:hypothetical protein